VEECLVFLVVEEGAVRDDIEPPTEPRGDQLAVDELCLPELRWSETSEPPMVATTSSRSSTATERSAARKRLPSSYAIVLLPEAIGPTITMSSGTRSSVVHRRRPRGEGHHGPGVSGQSRLGRGGHRCCRPGYLRRKAKWVSVASWPTSLNPDER
jgi:hypothetical protein